MSTIDLDAISANEARKFKAGALNSNNTGSAEATALLLRNCMQEAIHQALILASERATFIEKVYSGGGAIYKGVDKQSILDVEQLIK